MEKSKSEIDKNLRKLERESKKKDTKLKELSDIKEKLRATEAKIDEFQIKNDKTFADISVQTKEQKLIEKETQTDMTYSNIESLERNLNSARQEKNKFLNVVKNYEGKHGFSSHSN